MKIGINVEVCSTIECEHHVVYGRCYYLMDGCDTTHRGCWIPKECLHKTLHILMGEQRYREDCIGCQFRKGTIK